MGVRTNVTAYTCDASGCTGRSDVHEVPPGSFPSLPPGWWRVDDSVRNTESWAFCSMRCLATWAMNRAGRVEPFACLVEGCGWTYAGDDLDAIEAHIRRAHPSGLPPATRPLGVAGWGGRG